MKKKTAVLLVCAVCAASVAVGVAAKGVFREKRKNPKPEIERRAENDDEALKKATEWKEQLPEEAPVSEKTPVSEEAPVSQKEIPAFEKAPAVPDKTTDDKQAGRADKSTERPEKSVDTSERITEDRAKEAALERAGLKASDVTKIKAELDFDDGVWKYEVEFRHGGFEYDVDINAGNGSVLKFEKEYDD